MQLLLGEKSEPPAKKRKHSSVWFVPELMHIVAMCEERLPLVELGEEVNRVVIALMQQQCIVFIAVIILVVANISDATFLNVSYHRGSCGRDDHCCASTKCIFRGFCCILCHAFVERGNRAMLSLFEIKDKHI